MIGSFGCWLRKMINELSREMDEKDKEQTMMNVNGTKCIADFIENETRCPVSSSM